MNNTMQQQIIQFNRIFKRYDDAYRQAAHNFDMPELALWILYVVRENPVCTQKDIGDLLLQPKQSIHSAMKTLEQDGYVTLEYAENNRKNKYIHLTEKGIALAENTADKIVRAENLAFSALTDTERETLLNLFEHHLTFKNLDFLLFYEKFPHYSRTSFHSLFSRSYSIYPSRHCTLSR